MVINFKKSLVVLATVIAVLFIAPRIPVAFGTSLSANPTAVIATSYFNHALLPDKLTPQERQELQAVHQRRNREIIQVLNQSQRQQLEHYLRSGHSLEYSIEALDLERDQWDTIQAVLELSELKIKGILYRHSLPIESS